MPCRPVIASIYRLSEGIFSRAVEDLFGLLDAEKYVWHYGPSKRQ